ncbi:MAG TPA: penicillin-binding protein 2 [Bryobacteraceae bacterium]|nr:penicillin-binding protein 2 [Bryobacteraceae bacterium]
MILPPVDPNLEPRISDRPPLRDDTKFAAGKIAIFQYTAVAIFLFLISGFWKLQVQNPEFYDERAQQNSIKSVPILAPRGRILDRDGRVIVDNHSSFSLLLARESLKMEHLKPIAQGLDLDYDDLLARVEHFRTQPKYVPIVIKEELSPGDLAFVDSHRDFFPEMVLIQAQRRLYPQNGMMAHVIGYTGEISEDELDSPEFAKYSPGDVIGKFGVEREYNDVLMGVDGQRQVIVDNRGQVRQVIGVKPAVPGKDIRLTIDLDLQAVAELAMDGRNGAVVALDPRTGDVLAMVSRPTFDPNKFAVRIKAKDWQEIADNPDHPLLNRAIQAQLAPGSTFKPIMALAGLESGTIDDQYTVHCPGGATFYGHYYRCWQKGGHGAVKLHKGIVQSCDVYFYTIGNKMGIDTIANYASLVGFGQDSGIDLPHEASGVVPSPKWKLRNFRQKWYAGETISVAIGQGALTVTPLQLARAIGGIAVGGVWHHPHLLKSLDTTEKPSIWNLNPHNVQDVVDGMYGVVNEAGGTGGRARLPNIEVCGKTGTAQVASAQFVKNAGGGHNLKDNGWFVGFAPRQNPEIVVVALFEHSGEGYLSAPIVRDVMTAYFDKKERLAAAAKNRDAEQARLASMSALGLPEAGQGTQQMVVPATDARLRAADPPAPKSVDAVMMQATVPDKTAQPAKPAALAAEHIAPPAKSKASDSQPSAPEATQTAGATQ